MRFVTKVRLDCLRSWIQSAKDEPKWKEALQILESLERDIEENYAEIRKPIRLDDRQS